MACFQDQIKKFPWTRERLAALAKLARPLMDKKGATLEEVVNQLSAMTGLKPELIVKGISIRPKGLPRNITDEMWQVQNNRRAIEKQAHILATEWGTPAALKTARTIIDAPRRVAVWGHFTVFAKTHLADMLFTNPKAYLTAFGKMLALTTKSGQVAHAQRLLRMTIDPGYKEALRAGMDIEPGGGFREAFRTETQETTGSIKQKRNAMAFDELRMARFGIWKNTVAKLAAEERTPEDLKVVAEVINNATGASTLKYGFGKLLSRFLFAPRLFPAQFRAAYRDPIRAVYKAWFDRKNATPAELLASRYVIRRFTTLMVAYHAGLAAETAYSWATGDDRFKPNLTDPNRTDWLRYKLFGYSIPGLSPTIEMLRLPVRMFYAMAGARPGQSRLHSAGNVLEDYLVGRLNPVVGLGTELVTGQQIGTGRPLELKIPFTDTAFSGVVDLFKQQTSQLPPVKWTEFLGGKVMIPVANFSHELFDELRSNGLSFPDAKTWIQTLAIAGPEAITGYHLNADQDTLYSRIQDRLQQVPDYKSYPPEVQQKIVNRISRQESARMKAERKTVPGPGLP
jgi:hypothetical protein